MKRSPEPLALELNFKSELVGRNAWVLAPKGVLDSSTCDALKDRVQKFFDDAPAPAHFLLDMAGVKYISSVGLGALIGFLKQSREKNLTFALYDTQLAVQRVLEISKLDFLLVRPESVGGETPFLAYIREQEDTRQPLRKPPETPGSSSRRL